MQADHTAAGSSLPELKGAFPFRLGGTSYTIRDDYIPNIEFLCGFLDDVELLYFEPEDGFGFSRKMLDDMRRISLESSLSYTIHLPLDIDPGSFDPGIRADSVESCIRSIELFAEVAPLAYILHLTRRDSRQWWEADENRWVENLSASLEDIASCTAANVADICVENLFFPFDPVAEAALATGYSICFDVGHLLLTGGVPEDFLLRYGRHIKVVHLHGVSEEKDHLGLEVFDLDGFLRPLTDSFRLLPSLEVVTLELFSLKQLKSSMVLMEKLA